MSFGWDTISRTQLAALYVSPFVQGATMSVVLFFAPIHVHRSLGEERIALITLAIFTVPALVTFGASQVWGALSTRWGRLRPLPIVALGGLGVSLAVLSVLDSSAVFLAVFVGSTFFTAAMNPGVQAYATRIFEGAKGKAVSRLIIAASAGWCIGSVLCGTLVERGDPTGMRIVLRILGAFALLACFFVWHALPEIGDRGEGESARDRSWFRGLGAVYRHPGIRLVAGLTYVLSSATSLFVASFALYFTEVLGGAEELLGGTLATATLAGIAVLPWVGRVCDRWGRRPLFLATAAAYSVHFLLLALTRNPWIAALVFVVPLYPGVRVSTAAMLADLSSPETRAGGMGVLEATHALSMVTGSGLAAAAQWYGLSHAPFLIVSVSVLATLLSFLYLHKPRPGLGLNPVEGG